MVGDTVGIGEGEELLIPSQERTGSRVECCKADDLSLNGCYVCWEKPIVIFTAFKPIVKMAAVAGGGAIFARRGTVCLSGEVFSAAELTCSQLLLRTTHA